MARLSMNPVIMKNPITWIVNRPMMSMRDTVNQYPGTVPQRAIRVWALAILNISSRAFMVEALGIHPIALKMSFWKRFWL